MINLDGTNLTLEALIRIAKDHEQVGIAPNAIKKIDQGADVVNNIVIQNVPVYGINTGFGHLASVAIDFHDVRKLQENLLKSHACGTGKALDKAIVRAMMALRINALAKGNSGIRTITLNRLLDLLNKDIIPVVYDQGSLGASGDLVPLAHMALPLIGLGEVLVNDIRMSSKEALRQSGIDPDYHLAAKEGLALINGTQAMGAVGALALNHAYRLYHLSNLSYALSMEALGGIIDALDPRVHEARGHHSQQMAAQEMRTILEGSQALQQPNKNRVQDAYSLRCAPQVHGASLGVFDHVKEILETEMNAVTDNPLIFPEDGVAISAGNFHGQPLAMSFDYMGIAASELANISERRIERLVNPHLSNGLPAFLSFHPGLNSGFMIVQYVAASLVNQNKTFSYPASVDSIPSSANQEDHVSMGFNAATKATMIIDNAIKVIALELLTAAQALEFKSHSQLGAVTDQLFKRIRTHIPCVREDTEMYELIEVIVELVKNSAFDDLFPSRQRPKEPHHVFNT